MSQTLDPGKAVDGKTSLVKYEAARQALAEAVTVDEVKDILDRTAAIEEYARRSKDGELIALATEIKMRAEIRLGELLREEKAAGKLNVGHAGKGRPSLGGAAKEPPKTDNRPKLADMGIDKKLSSRSQRLAAEEPAEQEARIAKATRLAVAAAAGDNEVIKAARAETNKAKKEKRAAKERELAGKIAALPKRRYGVILADPEWQFDVWTENGKDRSADNHYTTSPLDVIKARDVPSIAADNCALFLWGTAPMLRQALEVMAAWGFNYVSHFVWAKPTAGTGYWNRSKHELLLVGTRGGIPAPAPGTQWLSVIEAPVGAHSAKPEIFYELIAHYYPSLPKIEINARQVRLGWDVWGNEAPGRGDECQATTPEDDFPDLPPALRRTA